MPEPAAGSGAGNARRAASQILSGPQFHAHRAKTFQPFAGALRAIGRSAAYVFDPVGRVAAAPFRALAQVIGRVGTLIVLLVLIAAVAAFAAAMIARRRARLGTERGRPHSGMTPEDPDALDRLAADAERRGDLETAVRVRFRAGLIRLERQGFVVGRETRTSADLAGTLHSPSFERLAADLDSILYAEQPAQPGQVEAARKLWPRVTEEAGARR